MDKKVAFLFPGQGAQYVKMGYDFYQEFKIAREIFEQANDLLGYKLTDIIFEGPEEKLKMTKYCQVAIFTASIAFFKVFESIYDCIPNICAGLSLGEYSALCAAKKIAFADCLKLVEARAIFMEEASTQFPGGLSVVLGLDPDQVEAMISPLDEKVWIANINCPKQVVISGSHSALKKAEIALKESGAKRVLPLDVSGPFHSGLMRQASDYLRPMIESTSFHHSSTEIVMNVTGNFVYEINQIKQNLASQVYSTTLWDQSIRLMDQKETSLYIECGPGKTLAGMNKKIGIQGVTFSIENCRELLDFEKWFKELRFH